MEMTHTYRLQNLCSYAKFFIRFIFLREMAATKPTRVTRHEGSYRELAKGNFREVIL